MSIDDRPMDGMSIVRLLEKAINKTCSYKIKYDIDFLESDSIYVNCNLKCDYISPRERDEAYDITYDIAKIVEKILNGTKYFTHNNQEWVKYEEPNYWDRNAVEVDDINEATTIQYMLYLQDKE